MACSAPQKALPEERGSAAPPLHGTSPRSRRGSREYFSVRIKICFFFFAAAAAAVPPPSPGSCTGAASSAPHGEEGSAPAGGVAPLSRCVSRVPLGSGVIDVVARSRFGFGLPRRPGSRRACSASAGLRRRDFSTRWTWRGGWHSPFPVQNAPGGFVLGVSAGLLSRRRGGCCHARCLPGRSSAPASRGSASGW